MIPSVVSRVLDKGHRENQVMRTEYYGRRRSCLRFSSIIVSLIFSLIFCFNANAEIPDDNERIAEIRAAIVYYVLKLSNLNQRSSDYDRALCVVGRDLLNSKIEATINPLIRNGLISKVTFFKPLDALRNGLHCSTVFIGESLPSNQSEKSAIHSIKKILLDKPVLTICGVKQQVWGECIVQIYNENNRSKLAIDLRLADLANIHLSSELLKLAKLKN